MESLIRRQSRNARPGWAASAAANILAPLAASAAFALAMHFLIGPWAGDYATRIMMDVGIAVILAVSLNIVNGFTGQFSIGHAAFMAAGGYVAGAITYYGSLLIWKDYAVVGGFLGVGQWLFFGACLAGGLVAAGLGWLVGLPSLRLRGDYLAIVTLGFGEIMRVLLQNTNRQIFDADSLQEAEWSDLVPPPLGGAQGFSDIPKYTNLFWVYLFTAAALIFAFRIKRSSTGRALLSIREDEIAAQSMGVNLTKYKVRAFVFAAVFAGLAGGLFAHQTGTLLRPVDAGFQRSIEVVIMVVLGGLGSISGTTMAAILLTVANEWLREPTHVWHLGIALVVGRLLLPMPHKVRGAIVLACVIGAAEGVRALAIWGGVNLGDYRMIMYALMLILVMIWRPSGLMGVREVWEIFGRGGEQRRLKRQIRKAEAAK